MEGWGLGRREGYRGMEKVKPRVSRLEGRRGWGMGDGEKARMVRNSNSESHQKRQGQANDYIRHLFRQAYLQWMTCVITNANIKTVRKDRDKINI